MYNYWLPASVQDWLSYGNTEGYKEENPFIRDALHRQNQDILREDNSFSSLYTSSFDSLGSKYKLLHPKLATVKFQNFKESQNGLGWKGP